MRAIALTAVILAPCHFTGIGTQVSLPDAVMGTEFGPTKAAEEAFRAIGARNAIRVADRMIYAAHFVMVAEAVP